MSSTVLLTIHAPTVPIVSERRLPGDLPLAAVKGRLELLCGVPVASQKLSLWTSRTDDRDSQATQIAELYDETQTLIDAGAQDGMGLLLTDTRSAAERDQFGEGEEAKVNKYEMADETYKQRADTVLAYKQRMKVGRFADNGDKGHNTTSDVQTAIKGGERCEVEGGRRGIVRYVGETDFAKGIWIGVQYDEPVGRNDGSVNGKRYFICAAKHGGFVTANKVQVGDYPERSIDEDMEDDEEL